MDIRRARRDEAAAIADVWIRSRRASIPAIPPPIHDDDQVRTYFEHVVLPTYDVWVAESDGAVIALLALHGDWIEHLYVDPDRVGAGVGSALLDVAKRERPGGLRLWTFEANAGARRFYERHGLTPTATTAGDNEEGAPDIHYVWPPPAEPEVSGDPSSTR